jgi:hypothetical protein
MSLFKLLINLVVCWLFVAACSCAELYYSNRIGTVFYIYTYLLLGWRFWSPTSAARILNSIQERLGFSFFNLFYGLWRNGAKFARVDWRLIIFCLNLMIFVLSKIWLAILYCFLLGYFITICTLWSINIKKLESKLVTNLGIWHRTVRNNAALIPEYMVYSAYVRIACIKKSIWKRRGGGSYLVTLLIIISRLPIRFLNLCDLILYTNVLAFILHKPEHGFSDLLYSYNRSFASGIQEWFFYQKGVLSIYLNE